MLRPRIQPPFGAAALSCSLLLLVSVAMPYASAQDGGAVGGRGQNASAASLPPLPQPMRGSDLAVAVEQVKIATVVDGRPLGPLHLRYELKMNDAKGKQHLGTYETWITPDAVRRDIHTDTYNGVEVLRDGRRWVVEDGLRPLRVTEFMEQQVMPNAAIARSLAGPKVPLKPRKINQASLMCGGNGQSANICFDPATGFIVLATVDGEVVAYETWRKLGWRYLAGVVRITRFDKNLEVDKTLVEAKMTVASGGASSDVFTVPQGAIESSLPATASGGATELGVTGPFAMVRLGPDTTNVGVDSSGKHRLLTRGGYGNVFPRTSGRAQVKVWVDERGHVSKAVLEDADDMDVADAALASARGSTYEPEQDSGHPISFETVFDFSVTVGEVVFR